MNTPTLADVEYLARQSGKILFDNYEKDFQVSHKGVIDLVTEVDHASERYLISTINQSFPGHAILAEESGAVGAISDHLWIIDPLDGTVNYAHGVPMFSVSIAYSFMGQVTLGAVYDPMRNEMFTGQRGQGSYLNGRRLKVTDTNSLEKSLMVTGFPYDAWNTRQDNFANFTKIGKMTQGVRRLGSAALDLCYVAAGRLDGYWEYSLKTWDLAAGSLIAEEAGALITTMQGTPDYMTTPHSVIVANPLLHDKLLEQLR